MGELVHEVVIEGPQEISVEVTYPVHEIELPDGLTAIANMLYQLQDIQNALIAQVQYPLFIQQEEPADVPGLWIKTDAQGTAVDLLFNPGVV